MQSPRTSAALLPATEVQSTFSGGMRDRDHPSLLEPNQYAYGKNIEIREAGLAKTRRGRTTKTDACGASLQAAIYYEPTNGNGMILQVNGGAAWKWEGSATAWTRVGTLQLTNTASRCALVVLNGIVYLFAGADDHVWSWDGAAADWTDEGDTNTDPPLASIAGVQSGRLLAVKGDYLYFSDIFDGHTWARSTNNKRIPTDGSEAGTAVATYRKEEALVWTRNSTHIFGSLNSADLANFTRSTLDPRVGCIAPLSPQVVGEDAFFMSADRQLRTIKRTVQDIAFGVSAPVSFLVPNLFERVTATAATKSAGAYFDNYYLIAAPMDGALVNSSVIAFDLLHQTALGPACVGEWTNIAAGAWCVTNFSGNHALYAIDANTGAAMLMFDGESDDGTTIPVQIDFRAPNWGAPSHDKTLHSGEVQMLDSIGTIALSYARDDSEWTSILTTSVGDTSSAVLPITLPFNLAIGGVLKTLPVSFYRRGQSRNWQLRLAFTGGKVNVKQVTLNAWVEAYRTR